MLIALAYPRALNQFNSGKKSASGKHTLLVVRMQAGVSEKTCSKIVKQAELV
jgi:hypothetical protein